MAANSGEFEGGGYELTRAARRLAISLTLVCAAFLTADIGLSVFGVRIEGPGRFASGLAVGWACSMTKARMMTRSFSRMMKPGGERAVMSFIINLIFRYVVTITAAVPVLLFTEIFGPAGFLGGLLSLPIGGYLGSLRR
ncbi:MAG: hypothetical protein LBS53_10800 [Synergistaceae bacterium]|jgi:hypothetical protein|nr:hypothetical protein [Synergistaceae bacterium]